MAACALKPLCLVEAGSSPWHVLDDRILVAPRHPQPSAAWAQDGARSPRDRPPREIVQIVRHLLLGDHEPLIGVRLVGLPEDRVPTRALLFRHSSMLAEARGFTS